MVSNLVDTDEEWLILVDTGEYIMVA